MNFQRLTQIKELLEEQGVDQIIISDPAMIFYLTGMWFSPGERLLVLLISRFDDDCLYLNELFPLSRDPGVALCWVKDSQDSVGLLSQALTGSVIAVDKNWPARFLLPLMAHNPERKFMLGSVIADEARLIKDETEQAVMGHASRLNDVAMTLIAREVRPGVSEMELAARLLKIYADLGAEGVSFAPIIAFGANGADPHHEPDHSMLQKGDSIIFDIGCRKDSYTSDMTRTYFFGEVSSEARQVYATVKEANLRAIATVRPGNTFAAVDKAARDYITAQGYGPYFTHRTGHGIGIDVHEPEDVCATNHHPLRPGMIFSIEPGIYLPGRLGVRIEDLVLVTEQGCAVLNQVSKDLTLLPSPEDSAARQQP